MSQVAKFIVCKISITGQTSWVDTEIEKLWVKCANPPDIASGFQEFVNFQRRLAEIVESNLESLNAFPLMYDLKGCKSVVDLVCPPAVSN